VARWNLSDAREAAWRISKALRIQGTYTPELQETLQPVVIAADATKLGNSLSYDRKWSYTVNRVGADEVIGLAPATNPGQVQNLNGFTIERMTVSGTTLAGNTLVTLSLLQGPAPAAGASVSGFGAYYTDTMLAMPEVVGGIVTTVGLVAANVNASSRSFYGHSETGTSDWLLQEDLDVVVRSYAQGTIANWFLLRVISTLASPLQINFSGTIL